MTLLDLITEALQDIAELGQGETPSAEDAAYCLGKANEWLDSAQTERNKIYQIAETSLVLPSGKQTYTIGVGASDFNQARPIKIEACAILVQVNGFYTKIGTCRIIGEPDWLAIADLSATANVPHVMYPDYGWPITNLSFYPAPNVTVPTRVQLSQWVALQQFAGLTDTFSMPYGYQKWFVDSLKVVIMKSYGHQIGQDDALMEQTSAQRIQQMNMQLPNLGLFNGIPAPSAGQ